MPVQISAQNTQAASNTTASYAAASTTTAAAGSTSSDLNGTTGAHVADFNKQTRSAQSDLATMNTLQNKMLTTADASTLSKLAASYATIQSDLSLHLNAAAIDASLDGSNTEGAAVSGLVQQATTLDQRVIGTLGPTDPHTAGLNNVDFIIKRKASIATGVAEERGANDQTIRWGNVSSNATLSHNGASGGFLANFPSTNSDGSLQTASNISTGTTWTDNASTNAFGTGAPQIEYGQQAQTGDCSSLSALNAVAATNPQAIFDHLKKVGTTPDGKNDLYNVTLWADGQWKTVQVDSSMPDGISAVPKDKNNMWESLYEKALATVYGGYDQVDWVLAMQSVTGRQEVYGYSDKDKAVSDIMSGNSEEAGTGQPTGWYDAQSGQSTAANAPGAINLIADHEYAVVGHTPSSVHSIEPLEWKLRPPERQR